MAIYAVYFSASAVYKYTYKDLRSKKPIFTVHHTNTEQMEIELSDLMGQLQGTWKQDNEDQSFEINGNELTVITDAKRVKTTFELIRNMQLRNWQIKVTKPMSWLRTFIVALSEDAFTIYDFDLKINMAMGARSKLLNPTRVYKYTRVAVEVEA